MKKSNVWVIPALLLQIAGLLILGANYGLKVFLVASLLFMSVLCYVLVEVYVHLEKYKHVENKKK